MNSKLSYIANWSQIAYKANWSVSQLTKECGVSVRTLERYFLKHMGTNPKEWLAAQRHHMALSLINDGLSIKEVAARLGYKYTHHFSREFKCQSGYSPSENHVMITPKGKTEVQVLVSPRKRVTAV